MKSNCCTIKLHANLYRVHSVLVYSVFTNVMCAEIKSSCDWNNCENGVLLILQIPWTTHRLKPTVQLLRQKPLPWSVSNRCDSFNHTKTSEEPWNASVSRHCHFKIHENWWVLRSVPGLEDELYFMITQTTDMHADMRSLLRRKRKKKGSIFTQSCS